MGEFPLLNEIPPTTEWSGTASAPAAQHRSAVGQLTSNIIGSGTSAGKDSSFHVVPPSEVTTGSLTNWESVNEQIVSPGTGCVVVAEHGGVLADTTATAMQLVLVGQLRPFWVKPKSVKLS
jgi:hypothetical protein